MKKHLSLAVLLLSAAGSALLAQQPAAPAKPATPAAPAEKPAAGSATKPESLHDRASYIIGLNLGRSLKAQDVPANTDLIVKGLRDGLGGATSVLNEEEIQTAMKDFQAELLAKQQEKQKVAGEANQKKSDEFLAANKAKAGVKTTASGLQYEVLKEGTGANPAKTDRVTVHYKGTLADGKVFDSSYDRNEPATFGVGEVIPGWIEALQLMKPGGKYRVVIPPNLAYGGSGAGDVIGPNAALVFEIELLSIAPPEAPKPAAPADAAGAADSKPEPKPAEEKPPGR
jgi:FKBP-type peptidyl-prolyl cis-trans isomerase FklB